MKRLLLGRIDAASLAWRPRLDDRLPLVMESPFFGTMTPAQAVQAVCPDGWRLEYTWAGRVWVYQYRGAWAVVGSGHFAPHLWNSYDVNSRRITMVGVLETALQGEYLNLIRFFANPDEFNRMHRLDNEEILDVLLDAPKPGARQLDIDIALSESRGETFNHEMRQWRLHSRGMRDTASLWSARVQELQQPESLARDVWRERIEAWQTALVEETAVVVVAFQMDGPKTIPGPYAWEQTVRNHYVALFSDVDPVPPGSLRRTIA